MATQKLKILELRDESEAESSGSDSEEDSASDMELTESDGEDEVAIDAALSDDDNGEDEVNTQKKAPVKEGRKKKASKEAKKKKVAKKIAKKKSNKKKDGISKKSIKNLKQAVKNGKSVKDDGVMNAEKNKLDEGEDLIKKPPPPFEELGDIVDMNKDSSSNVDLCKKIYRITPKGSAMQYTIKADHRSAVTKSNGEKYGIYPTLVQSKFRVDERRPMGKDGKEKAPWTMDCDLKELPTILKVLKKIQNNNSGFFD